MRCIGRVSSWLCSLRIFDGKLLLNGDQILPRWEDSPLRRFTKDYLFEPYDSSKELALAIAIREEIWLQRGIDFSLHRIMQLPLHDMIQGLTCTP